LTYTNEEKLPHFSCDGGAVLIAGTDLWDVFPPLGPVCCVDDRVSHSVDRRIKLPDRQ
jgi:hypothetical protein